MPKLNKYDAGNLILACSLVILVSCSKSSPSGSDNHTVETEQQAAESTDAAQSTLEPVPTVSVGTVPSFGAASPVDQVASAIPLTSVDSTVSPVNAASTTDSLAEVAAELPVAVEPVPEVVPESVVTPQTEVKPEPDSALEREVAPETEDSPEPEVILEPEAVPEPVAVPEPEDTTEAETGTEPDTAFCEGYISSASSVAVPELSKPEYLQPFRDPMFGALVTRITDGAFGEVNKPAYSTMQAWNADESLLLLYRTGASDAGHKLYDGHSYEFVQDLDITPSDIEQVFWSRTDPDVFFYISKRSSDYGKLKQFNVSRNQSVELADFSAQCGAGLPNAGNDVQMHAINDDLFGFTCQQDDGHHLMFSYKPSTAEVITAAVGQGTGWQVGSAPAVAASGNRLWHQGKVIDTDLATVNFELDLANDVEHSSMGETHDGQDAYYQVSFNSSPNGCEGDLYSGVGHLVEHNLETGACRNIISQEQGYPYTTSSTHVSALSIDKPERVAMSSIGNSSQLPLLSNGVAAPALFSEIYVAQTTPNDTVICRLAHHRSYGKSATNGGYAAYFGEPHATISPSGTRIIFGSDWYDSGTVDSYVLELPDYLKP